MQIEVTKTRQGLAKIVWIQMIPKSGVRRERRSLFLWLGFCGLIGIVLAAKSIDTPLDAAYYFAIGAGAGWFLFALGASKRPDSMQAVERAMRRPSFKPQYCEAYLFQLPNGMHIFRRDQYKGRFKWGRPFVAELPVESVTAFISGSHREWFGAVADAPNYDSANYPDSSVIVVEAPDGTVIQVAQHGYGKADIVRLHRELTNNFSNFVPRLQVSTPAPRAAVSPIRSDELPRSL